MRSVPLLLSVAAGALLGCSAGLRTADSGAGDVVSPGLAHFVLKRVP